MLADICHSGICIVLAAEDGLQRIKAALQLVPRSKVQVNESCYTFDAEIRFQSKSQAARFVLGCEACKPRNVWLKKVLC